MKTYKYIALAAIAIGFTACTQDDDFTTQQADIVKIASANIATEVQTRVNTLDNGSMWENADQILLVNNSRDTKNSGIYTATVSEGTTTWALSSGTVLYASGANTTNNFSAYYPAVAEADYTLPTDQSDETKIKSADRMIATATGVDKGAAVALRFERQHAMITINPSFNSEFSSNATISSLQINGISPYHQTGQTSYKAIIKPSEEGFSVSLVVGGQQLAANSTVKIEAGKHYTFNLKIGKEAIITDNVTVQPWGEKDPLATGDAEEIGIPYLTFTCEDEEKFYILEPEYGFLYNNKFQYSVNNGEWKDFPQSSNNTVKFGGTNGNLRLRGKSITGTCTSTDAFNVAQIIFTNGKSVACTGDIRTLIDYENYSTVSTEEARFCYLFFGCRLTSAPDLPATTLADGCYAYMFRECTSLTTAPELPAKTLAPNCYSSMFNYCYTLTEAPELPATTLAEGCYSYMFVNCYNLKNVKMLATSVNAESVFYNWLYLDGEENRAGTITLKEGVDLPKDSPSGIPKGWTVINSNTP